MLFRACKKYMILLIIIFFIVPTLNLHTIKRAEFIIRELSRDLIIYTRRKKKNQVFPYDKC